MVRIGGNMSNFVTNKDILTRLENLERAFLQSQRNTTITVAKSDRVQGIATRVSDLAIDVEENATAIEETNVGLMETYEATIGNTSEIEDCNIALMELYEMIAQ